MAHQQGHPYHQFLPPELLRMPQRSRNEQDLIHLPPSYYTQDHTLPVYHQQVLQPTPYTIHPQQILPPRSTEMQHPFLVQQTLERQQHMPHGLPDLFLVQQTLERQQHMPHGLPDPFLVQQTLERQQHMPHGLPDPFLVQQTLERQQHMPHGLPDPFLVQQTLERQQHMPHGLPDPFLVQQTLERQQHMPHGLPDPFLVQQTLERQQHMPHGLPDPFLVQQTLERQQHMPHGLPDPFLVQQTLERQQHMPHGLPDPFLVQQTLERQQHMPHGLPDPLISDGARSRAGVSSPSAKDLHLSSWRAMEGEESPWTEALERHVERGGGQRAAAGMNVEEPTKPRVSYMDEDAAGMVSGEREGLEEEGGEICGKRVLQPSSAGPEGD
ncbi:hypothetical protein GUITHDRAFT_144561 [Guillardia theta CCMP2712]|uniref:Uncharacterized protein n=1 Tax=Guillardia theta (strain CCMP2712) TaxID=905079 RepID=L1IP54_GUITC|nr:hypothetical protein GUITHDRAFT_144561 [Guillardia theta CCMP2712]EKX38071.1 hypothetical protein GUITHDRAFT_144561 [Guillardia theta CCMP2712]|eukprot:XP_005825051.1 hypothetical protein GUITHDRAFT_144561 [Guillardia theta CCMP2712]